MSITRRAMLATLPAALLSNTRKTGATSSAPFVLTGATVPSTRKARPLPNVGEFVRFIDPTTETPVVRLTNPASTSLLPASSNRFVSPRDRFLVFSSDRAGKPSPYRLDLRTGAIDVITQTSHLDSRSLCLDAHDRSLYLLDGGVLTEISLANKRSKIIAEDVSAFSCGSLPADFAIVRKNSLEWLGGGQRQIAEAIDSWCLVRPGGKGCAFGRQISGEEREFWYGPFAEDARPTLLASGRISDPVWAPDGSSLLFLREVPGQGAFLSEIHEAIPETGVSHRVAPTSAFAVFAPNGDGSVFVGASRSKAQPTVILLVRSVQRELTLCEHRATHPKSVSPAFSPDSRRVYFESDHEGKSALYSVNVELLVEPTITKA